MNKQKMTISFYTVGLLLVVGFALVLRLWQIGSVPLSPDWDEAALGYNAYSILTTGKDEYGVQLPVVLKSFGDYKPALYAYLIVPLIPIFDLSLLAVRLPSVIAGVIAVLVMYFLTKELLVNSKQIQNSNEQNNKNLLEIRNWKLEIPIIAAALLAISPWHIQLSRVAFEANVGLTCIMLTVLFFLYGLKQGKYLILAAFFAAIGLYTYQSEKVFLPLLLLSLAIIYKKELLALPKKWLASALVIGILVSLPLGIYMINNPESVARAKMTSVISKGDAILERSAKRLIRDRQDGDIVGQLFNDRRVVYAKTILNGHIVHFDPNWLFITGDIARHHAPGMGLFYIWELPFIVIGFIGILSLKNRKSLAFILSWLLLAPIPAALTFDVPHAVRTLQLLPPLVLLSAYGLWVSYNAVMKLQYHKTVKYGVAGIFGLFVVGVFLYYLNQYFVQQNYFYAKDWQYGYKEAIAKVQEQKGRYENIIVSSEVPMDQSYIFFLYYLKYPPANYQAEYEHDANIRSFDNYTFRNLDWEVDKHLKNTLLIGSPNDFPKEIRGIKTINNPDTTEAIKLVDPTLL